MCCCCSGEKYFPNNFEKCCRVDNPSGEMIWILKSGTVLVMYTRLSEDGVLKIPAHMISRVQPSILSD